MATFTSAQFGNLIMAPHSAGVVYVSDDIVTVTTALTADDILKVGYLPAGCVPIDVIVIADEIDSHGTDTLAMEVGLLNDDEDDIITAASFVAAAQADTAPTVTRAAAIGMVGIAPDEDDDRILAVKITTEAATAVAGDVRVIMTYRASNYGA